MSVAFSPWDILVCERLLLSDDEQDAIDALCDERKDRGVCPSCGGVIDSEPQRPNSDRGKICTDCSVLVARRQQARAERTARGVCKICEGAMTGPVREGQRLCNDCVARQSRARARRDGNPNPHPCARCGSEVYRSAQYCGPCHQLFTDENARRKARALAHRQQGPRPCPLCAESMPTGRVMCETCDAEEIRRTQKPTHPTGNCAVCNDLVWDGKEFCAPCASSDPLVVLRHLEVKRAEARKRGLCVSCLVDYSVGASDLCRDCERERPRPMHIAGVDQKGTHLWR